MAIMEFTTARLLCETLKTMNVKRVYGIIGTSVLDFVDILYDYKHTIRYVTVRHEQVAVSMADAESRVSGGFGVALVHAGPGFLNSLISLGIAYKDRVPLLLISGGVRRRLFKTNSWLEVDQESIAKPISKYYVRIDSPEDALNAISEAFINLRKPPGGPVVLEVAEDVWNMKVKVKKDYFEELSKSSTYSKEVSEDSVLNVLEDLKRSERPLILACGEVANPGIEDLLKELAERIGAYVVTSGNGRGSCPEDHPKCLGRVGFGGGAVPADYALKECDYLLVLGSEFDDITTYAYTLLPKGNILVVSLDPLVDLRPTYYEVLRVDPYVFTHKLVEIAKKKELRLSKPNWDILVDEAKHRWESILHDALTRSYERSVNPAKFFKKLDEALPRDKVITAGQGMHVLYTYDFMRVYSVRSFLASTNLGAMGYAFPAALGAKLAMPHRKVVAVVGDGDFMMTLQDLETAVRENIPVNVIVVNDHSYRVLYFRQVVQKMGKIYGTLLGNPDFVKIAESFRVKGIAVENDNDIEYAINTIVKMQEPLVIDLRINKDDLPPLNLEASLRMTEV
ncbi:MAG: thiamine pyrophosphate-binding protein [Thermoprotei archaeon]